MTRGNELAGESSPYLLQHAHNPAHWKPWGPAAFDEARRRDVPIFLSVGYATCHWCHVMERESFEDEAIARIMNDHFVCIKVDREERPEVDEPYMLATQLMTGSGGWPMSVFLEPAELRPFWCATYLPPRPHPHGAGPSFPQVLESIAQAWRQQRSEIMQQAEAVAQAVRENMAPPGPAPIGAGQVSAAVESLLRMFDRTHGGFGAAPKFPQPSFLELLLAARDRVDEGPRRAIDEAARRTLDRMAVGGLRDHVGGGFHRYCVDATWTVPHFEKMLYDNALLAALYARASRIYTDDFYADVARDTFGYIARKMTSPEGAFWCAQDADTDGHEGATYLWTAAQLREVLNPDDAEFAIRIYGVDRGPNFRDPHHPDDEPANILRLDDRPGALAERYGMTPGDLEARLGAINGPLLAARAQRPQPGLDDKILVAWNGMMIAAMAECAELLGDRSLLDRAAAAAEFIEREMTSADGLGRTWRAGQPGPAATLEDYAWLLTGLAAIARAPGAPPGLLARCDRLHDEASRRFEDPQRPGLFYDAPADSGFFVRVRSTYDGATPSASSTMLGALIDLAQLDRATDVGSATSVVPSNPQQWLARAQESLAALSGAIAANPLATVNATRHLLRMLRIDPALGADARTPAPEAAPAPTPAVPPTPAESFTPVEIYADRERITLGPGQPAELNLIVRIAPGHHIYTPDTPHNPIASDTPGAPLRIHLIRGAGVQVYVDAPEGEPVEAAEGARAFRGEVEIRVALERTGELVGKPLLGVTFQACADSACLPPTTVELDVAIDITG